MFLSLKLFHSSASLCSNAPFLSFSLCMCVCLNVCVWPHKLLTLSVFMLASRTPAKQCSQTFILFFFFFFVFQHFCFNKPSRNSPAKQMAPVIIDESHLELKLPFICVQCACVTRHVKAMSIVTEEKWRAAGVGWCLQIKRGGFGFGMC